MAQIHQKTMLFKDKFNALAQSVLEKEGQIQDLKNKLTAAQSEGMKSAEMAEPARG